MKSRLVVALIMLAVLGCGHGEENAIYNTADNPDNFPAPAVELLVHLESGRVAGADDITNAFGDLYTAHSDLLDNQAWKGVIKRLGSYFNKTADSLALFGPVSYTGAAEYYQLASFARPDDPTLRRQAALFATWLDGLQDSTINLAAMTDERAPELTDLITIARYFLQADQTHHDFYGDYLQESIVNLTVANDILTPEAIQTLTPSDQAWLDSAGFTLN